MPPIYHRWGAGKAYNREAPICTNNSASFHQRKGKNGGLAQEKRSTIGDKTHNSPAKYKRKSVPLPCRVSRADSGRE